MSVNTSFTALEIVAAALAFGKNIGVKFTVYSLNNPASANTISLDRAGAIAAIEGAVMHLKANPGHDGPRVRKSNLPSKHQRGQFKIPAEALSVTASQAVAHSAVDRHPAELTVQAVDQRLYTRPIVEQAPFKRTNADRFNRDHSQKYRKGKWVTATKPKYLAAKKATVRACAPIQDAATLPGSAQAVLLGGRVLPIMPITTTFEVAPAMAPFGLSVVARSPPTHVSSTSTSVTALHSGGTTPFTWACSLALPQAVDATSDVGALPSPNTMEATPSTSSQASDSAAADICAAEIASAAIATSSPPSSCPSPSAFATPQLSSAFATTLSTLSQASDYAAAETCAAETASAAVATTSSDYSCPSPSASATPLLSSATSAFGPADELSTTEIQGNGAVDRHPAELTVQAVDQRLYTRPIVEQHPFNRTRPDRFNCAHVQKYHKGKWVTATQAKYLAMTETKVSACVPFKAARRVSTQAGLPAFSILDIMPTSATNEGARFKSTQGGTAPATESPSMSVFTPSPPTPVPSPPTSATAFPSSETSISTSAGSLGLPRAGDSIGDIGALPSPNTIEPTPSMSSPIRHHAAAETCTADTACPAVETSSPPSSCPSPSASATPLLSSATSTFTSASSLSLPLATNPVRKLSESEREDFALLYESVHGLLGTDASTAAGASLTESPSNGDALRCKSRKVAKRVRSLGTALKRKLSKAF